MTASVLGEQMDRSCHCEPFTVRTACPYFPAVLEHHHRRTLDNYLPEGLYCEVPEASALEYKEIPRAIPAKSARGMRRLTSWTRIPTPAPQAAGPQHAATTSR